MQQDIRNIQAVGRWVHKARSAIVIGCVGTCGGGTLLLYRLNQLFDPHEIVAMGVTIVAVSACGRYALVKARQALRGEATPIQDFINMVRGRFANTPQATEEPAAGWVEQMASRYRPGRSSYALPVGMSESGKLVEVSMSESESHLIIQGASGYGKSYLVNQTILGAALTGLYQVVLIGKSTKDFAAVSQMNNVHPVRLRESAAADEMGVSYPEQLLGALNSAYMELCTRQRLLEDKSVSKMANIRMRDRPQSILIVIDEFSNAVLSADNSSSKLSRQLQGRVTQIAQEGRAVNMHLLLVGQRAAAVIDKRLRAQMVSIVYRTKDATESYLATGSKEINAHQLIVGDPKNGRPHQIAICDERRNRYAFVPATPASDFKRLAELDTSEVGEEPFWLHGYQSPNRTASVPSVVENQSKIDRTRRVEQTVLASVSPEVEVEIIAKTTGTGTVSTVVPSNVGNLRNWAGELFDSHEDYTDPPSRLSRDRVITIALCGLIGLSENATMRAVFNGNTKSEYRVDVKQVFSHMAEAGFNVA